jgi:hypothetical protein
VEERRGECIGCSTSEYWGRNGGRREAGFRAPQCGGEENGIRQKTLEDRENVPAILLNLKPIPDALDGQQRATRIEELCSVSTNSIIPEPNVLQPQGVPDLESTEMWRLSSGTKEIDRPAQHQDVLKYHGRLCSVIAKLFVFPSRGSGSVEPTRIYLC